MISGETTTGRANTAPVRSLGANECGVRLPPLRRTDVVQQQDIGLRANAYASTLLARVTDGPTLEAYQGAENPGATPGICSQTTAPKMGREAAKLAG